MMSPGIEQLLIHTITLEKASTTAASGDKTFGSAVTVKARVENRARLVRDSSGREVASNTFIIAKAVDTNGDAVTFEATDRITLPAGFAPSQPPIVSIARCDDASGLHHWEIRA